MEHYNDKGIAIEHVQIKPHNQFNIALQPRASIKKSKSIQHKAYQLTWTRLSPTSGLCHANSATHKY
jgi:hypothetical protein